MHRKHYTMIANVLAGDYATASKGEKRKVEGITLSLADKFLQDNPAFDRAKFYAAVGIPATCS